MPPLPRSTCPRCGRSVPVRRNGELREHRPNSTVERAVDLCPGSGEKPEGLFDDD